MVRQFRIPFVWWSEYKIGNYFNEQFYFASNEDGKYCEKERVKKVTDLEVNKLPTTPHRIYKWLCFSSLLRQCLSGSMKKKASLNFRNVQHKSVDMTICIWKWGRKYFMWMHCQLFSLVCLQQRIYLQRSSDLWEKCRDVSLPIQQNR